MSGALDRLAAALSDRYRLEREIGAGGMATVYLAHDLKHQRDVAIKVLHPDLGAALGGERFLSEIRTTARLQHPHILPLLDSGEAEGLLYYVMPLVTGETLRARLEREKQLPIKDAVLIAREAADALGYAHDLGVIHRDIKPENILLQGGHALVADFGIALAVQQAGGARMTQTGLSLGTPQYMSPEQAMGERSIDARSDIYALGAVTYEMLAGDPPFTGSSVQAIVAKVMTEKPSPITTVRDTVPPHVEDAVLTALAKLPADRFATARAFADALGDAGSGRTRTSGLVSGKQQLLGPRSIALIAGAALLIGAIGATLVTRRQPTLTAPMRVALQLRAGQELRASVSPGIAAVPAGSGVIYVGPGVNATTQLWLRRWDQLSSERLSQSVDGSCCIAFSPSGDTVAYLSSPRQLNVLPLTGGLPTQLPDLGLISMTDWGGGLDWGSDGFLYAVANEGVIRIDPRNGTKTLIVPLDSARGDLIFLWPQLLPGDEAAVVTVVPKAAPFDPARASIGIADLRIGKVAIVQQGVRAIYAPTGHLLIAKANGVLWAVAFDAHSRQLSGAARELTDTVAVRFGNSSPGIVDLALDRRGTLTYAAGGGSLLDMAWVERSGAWRPVAEGAEPTIIDSPALEPGGRRLVVSLTGEDQNIHLWIQPVDQGPRVRLTFAGNLNFRARWRPGTRMISFQSNREEPGSALNRLYQQNADGSGSASRLSIGDPRAVGGHAWSPDGTWLVFRTDNQEPGGGDIMAIRPGVDSVARALVATAAEEFAPTVSPDGRWLAYSSNESGRREIYVRPFPETGTGRYQVSTAGGVTPVWSATGRELFYVDDTPQMIAVPIVPGASFQTGQPASLFSMALYYNQPFHPQYDVSPDGQRFVMGRRRASTDIGIVAVFNFLDELKRRMAAP